MRRVVAGTTAGPTAAPGRPSREPAVKESPRPGPTRTRRTSRHASRVRSLFRRRRRRAEDTIEDERETERRTESIKPITHVPRGHYRVHVSVSRAGGLVRAANRRDPRGNRTRETIEKPHGPDETTLPLTAHRSPSSDSRSRTTGGTPIRRGRGRTLRRRVFGIRLHHFLHGTTARR